MDKQLTVLITRPQPGADAFAAVMDDVPTVVSPLMEIKTTTADLGAPDVLVITSSHAIDAVSGLAGDPICYCVGATTTERARAAGVNAIMAGETAEAVAARVIKDQPTGKIVYARGRHVAFDMQDALRMAGLKMSEAVVYEQVDVPLSHYALNLLGRGEKVIVPLFSARSAALFFDVCPDDADIQVIAISANVAGLVPDMHSEHVDIVPNPDANTMALAVRNAALSGKRLEQGE